MALKNFFITIRLHLLELLSTLSKRYLLLPYTFFCLWPFTADILFFIARVSFLLLLIPK